MLPYTMGLRGILLIIGSAGFHSMDVKFGSAPFLQIMDRNKAGIILA